MIKEDITFKTVDGESVTKTFRFNLSVPELAEMEFIDENGKLSEKLLKISSDNVADMMSTFKKMISDSFGERSEDGLSFEKSKARSDWFLQTDAFNQLFIRMLTDANYAAKFIEGVMPENLEELAQQASAKYEEIKAQQAGVKAALADLPVETLDVNLAAARIQDEPVRPSGLDLSSMTKEDLIAAMEEFRGRGTQE